VRAGLAELRPTHRRGLLRALKSRGANRAVGHDGLPNAEIARQTGTSRPTVVGWRARYEIGGVAALGDLPGAAENEVDVTDSRRCQRTADVQAAAGVARVLTWCAVVDVALPRAVRSAAAQLRVERVEGLDADRAGS
jgi:hypothetical protein